MVTSIWSSLLILFWANAIQGSSKVLTPDSQLRLHGVVVDQNTSNTTNSTGNNSNTSNNTSSGGFRQRLQVFTDEMDFEGQWEAYTPSTLLNGFSSTRGPCQLTYMVSPNSNTTRVLLTLLEDGFSDGKVTYLYLNLSNSSVNLELGEAKMQVEPNTSRQQLRLYYLERGEVRNSSDLEDAKVELWWKDTFGQRRDIRHMSSASELRTEYRLESSRNTHSKCVCIVRVCSDSDCVRVLGTSPSFRL